MRSNAMLGRLGSAFLLLAIASAASAQSDDADVLALDDGSGGGAGYRFEPAELRAAPGAKLVVAAPSTNAEPHSLTHDAPIGERKFNALPIDPGARVDLTAPTDPGEYAFLCVFHAEMRGTLVVENATQPAPTTTTQATSAGGQDTPLPWAILLAGALVAAVLRRQTSN